MPGNGLSGRWDAVKGLRIFSRCAQRDPSRPAVVLVHGLSMSSLYLAPAAARLAENYSVYAPDLPGFGRSDKPDKIFTIEELAGFLEAWIEELGLGELALLGNSLGSQIIVEHALQHPGRAGKLILTALTPDPERRSLLQHLFRLLLAGMLEPPSFHPVMVKDYLAAGLRRTLATARYLLDDPIEHKLLQVKVPALVVRGSRDPIISTEWAEKAARLLPQGSLAQIPGAGHALNWSFPAQLSQAAVKFIGGNQLPGFS